MLLSIAAQNASLDNDYGASAGSHAPTSHEVALFDGDPEQGGAELTSDGGYARVTITNDGTTWAAADGGAKTSADVVFATSTDAWSDTATWFVLYDAADSVTAWDAGLLADELAVDASGAVAVATLTIYFDEGGSL